MKNEILFTSWGYGTSIVDFCEVISETEKTLLCQMISCKVENDNGQGQGRAYPNKNNKYGKVFRLRKRPDKKTFVGSYPYTKGSENKRKGYFWKYEGNGHYYNTWD